MSIPPKTRLRNDPYPVVPKEGNYTPDTLKLFARLVEQSSDILIATDIEYRPLTWNKAAEKIFGLTSEQVIGKDVRQFLEIHHNTNKKIVRDIIKRHGEWRDEISFVRPGNQQTITLILSLKELRENDKTVLGYLISATDITERKQTESKLKENEQRFRDIADSSPAMIWLSDENEITVYANKKWIEFTGKDIGYGPEGWSSLIHPDDRMKSTEAYFQAVEQKKQITIVYRLRRSDGVYRWVHDVSVPRFLDSGKFIGYAGSVIDIEDEMQKHEQLIYQATILENVSDIVVTTDLNFNVTSWNKIAEDHYSITEQEALGQSIGKLLKFEFSDIREEESLTQLNEKGFWKGEVSLVNRRGETKHFFHTVKYMEDSGGNRIGCLSIGRDITEKKIADEKLKESEVFYRTLIADSLDGMLLLGKTGTIKFASPSVKNVVGYDDTEVIGRNGFEFVHPDDIAWAIASFQREVEEKPEIKFVTIRLLQKNGGWLWCNVRAHNLLDNPYINSIVIYFHDDTRRKQAKDALEESENRFRSLVRDLQIGVFMCDGIGNIIMCNRALSEMLCISEEMVIGKNVYNIMSSDMVNEDGEFVAIPERPLTKTFRSKQTIKDAVLGVVHPVTKERSWIMVNADPVLDEEGAIKHVVCSVMDLTERKKLEQKLILNQIAHQRQLTQATIDGQENERRAIGEELHDNIGQQLTTIKLVLDYAKTSVDQSAQEAMNMALKSVGDVIDEVRNMSRSLVPFTLKDLGLIDSINELIYSLIRTRTIKIEFQHAGFNEKMIPENQKLSLFRIVQEQLNNILKHSEAEKVLIRLLSKTDEFVLEITDNGKGFDSSRTRKGVGILNIRNRAELFNGRADIFTKPGKGCRLEVSFPFSIHKSARR